MDNRIALRIDDIGASSKRYEVYSHSLRGVGNWLFLKYIDPFRKWGPYREMSPEEWRSVYKLLRKYNAKLTVGVTACWVDSENELIPFHEKFPEEASILKEGVMEGLLEIANHGLTHCVTAGNVFKPRLFSSNRKYHREFYDWLPEQIHREHIEKSQKILEGSFGIRIETLIPPGNQFAPVTFQYAAQYGIKYVSCNGLAPAYQNVRPVPNHLVFAFHDREIVLHGIDWLEKQLVTLGNRKFHFVKELAVN